MCAHTVRPCSSATLCNRFALSAPWCLQVIGLCQLLLGIALQPDWRLRGSTDDHANVWSALAELILASNKVSAGKAGLLHANCMGRRDCGLPAAPTLTICPLTCSHQPSASAYSLWRWHCRRCAPWGSRGCVGCVCMAVLACGFVGAKRVHSPVPPRSSGCIARLIGRPRIHVLLPSLLSFSLPSWCRRSFDRWCTAGIRTSTRSGSACWPATAPLA